MDKQIRYIKTEATPSPVNPRIKKVFTVLLICGPIIRIYKSMIPGIDMFELSMIILLFFAVLPGRTKGIPFSIRNISSNNFSLWLLYYWIACMIISCVSLTVGMAMGWPVSVYDLIIRSFRWLFYIVVLYFSYVLFDKEFALKLLKIISVTVCILLFVQIFWYNFTGNILTMKIPGLRLDGGFGTMERQLDYASRHVFRAYSVFLEPAHFSYYVLVSLMAMLFLEKKPNYPIAVLYSLSLFSSSSSSAIVLTMAIWVYYVFYTIFSVHGKKFDWKFAVWIGVICICVVLAMQLPAVQFGLGKILSNDNTTIVSSSRTTEYRLYVGMLTPLQRLIGIGLGNEETFFGTQFNVPELYMNTLGYLITNVGYIGLFLFAAIMIICAIKAPTNCKIFVLVFIVCNLFSGMVFSSNMIHFLVWVVACDAKTRQTKIGNLAVPNTKLLEKRLKFSYIKK